MTLSPFQKALLSSMCVGSAVFTAATLPLAIFRSQPVEVQVRNESIFSSELSALAAPYLGIAGVFSTAVGVGILGVSGWRSAARKSEDEQAKSSKLQKSLLDYQVELERIKFSDARLTAQNLGTFLEPQNASSPQAIAAVPAHQLSAVSTLGPTAVENNHSLVTHSPVRTSENKPLATTSQTRIDHLQSSYHHNEAKVMTPGVLDLVMHRLREPAPQPSGKYDTPSTNANVASLSGIEHRTAVAAPDGTLNHKLSHTTSHTEAAPDNQFDLLLHQLRDLTAQIEDLRASETSQAAA